VESFVFVVLFFSTMAFLVVFFGSLISGVIDFRAYDAIESFCMALGIFIGVNLAMTLVFLRRQCFSRDELRLLGKILMVAYVLLPLFVVLLVVANCYAFVLFQLTDRISLRVGSFLVLFEFLMVMVVLKKIAGRKISQWYHLKPLSGVGSLRQVNRYLKDAERRLGKKQFEGASEGFHSAAQMYVSVEDWRKAADCYWLAAETLAKDSLDLRFGVATLYVLSAAAYLLCDDVGKADEAVRRVKEIPKDPKVDDRGLIGFMVEVLEAVETGDPELLQEDRQKLLKSIKDKFEAYGEETALLVNKNLERLQQELDHR
jgi:hypothetical protein